MTALIICGAGLCTLVGLFGITACMLSSQISRREEGAGKIHNETSTTGALLCVVCNKPSVWTVTRDVRMTSPLRRVKVRNLDALVHESCLPELYADMAKQLKRALFVSRMRELGRGAWRFSLNTVLLVWYSVLYVLFYVLWPVRWAWRKARA